APQRARAGGEYRGDARAAARGWRGGDRGSLRLAWDGPIGDRGGQRARLSADRRDHGGGVGRGGTEQPGGGPGFARARSADSTCMPPWRLIRKPLATTALAVLVLTHVVVFVGPYLWGVSPQQTSALDALLPPGGGHPLGTDELGRDELSR